MLEVYTTLYRNEEHYSADYAGVNGKIAPKFQGNLSGVREAYFIRRAGGL